jgi:serine/threonine-protein phosphatase 2A regulatory subunit A
MYPRLPGAGLQRELRTVFSSLCVDETPMVRRAVCAEFPAFVAVVAEEDVVSDLLGAFARLSKDDQDSVRLICVDACVALLGVFRRHDAVHRLLPFVFALCTDRSWRVRYVVADRFPQVLAAIGAGTLTGDEVADCYNKLLLDPENEVRTAAARQLYSTCELLGADRTSRCLLKAVKQLATDTCQFTRAALGKEIMFLALVLSNKDFLAHILPLFLLMLKDTHSQVRINLISRLEFVQPVLGEDTLAQALLPAVCQLALDPQWRVRLAIIQHVPRLAAQLGARFFEVKLADLAMSWVGDTVACVRDAAGNNFMQLTQVFGSPWCVRHLVPRLDHLSTRKSFLYRVTALSILQTLLRVIRLDSACQHLLPILTRLAEDAVPNVRFVAIKAIRVLLCRLDGRPLPPMQGPNDAVLAASPQADEETTRSQNNASRATSAPIPVRSATKSGTELGEPLADIEADTRAETDRTTRATEEARRARAAIWARVGSLTEDQDRDVAYAATQLQEEVRGG